MTRGTRIGLLAALFALGIEAGWLHSGARAQTPERPPAAPPKEQPAQSAPPTAQPGDAPAKPSDAPAKPPAAGAEKRAPKDRFIPSEEVSPENDVPFPVDI